MEKPRSRVGSTPQVADPTRGEGRFEGSGSSPTRQSLPHASWRHASFHLCVADAPTGPRLQAVVSPAPLVSLRWLEGSLGFPGLGEVGVEREKEACWKGGGRGERCPGKGSGVGFRKRVRTTDPPRRAPPAGVQLAFMTPRPPEEVPRVPFTWWTSELLLSRDRAPPGVLTPRRQRGQS